jgi:hypothetical protein
MKDKDVIVFTKNKNDAYFRKSTEFASADVTLLDDAKSTGAVERLSATILKGVQDQLFSIARQKQIETMTKELIVKYSEEYKKSFIDNCIKKAKKADKGKTLEQIESEAQRDFDIRSKNIYSLAEKKAWRETINSEVTEDELTFRFDAKSIFAYAKIHGTKKDRLYEDVKRVQDKFNNWTEKHFDVEQGEIVNKEQKGVLFPHSSYTHGVNSEIEIHLSRQMVHMVLFLSKNFLKYHLDSYIAVSTPNATRLYEILIDYISGNLFVSGKDLTFEYLQPKFGTKYKQFRLFLRMVITSSLEKINSELGTKLTWAVDKKKGRNIYSIKFNISDYDRKVLQGIRDENIDDSILYSFEYYLALLSLGGQKAQGGLRALYEKIRGQVSDGDFDYFGKTREEALDDHMNNISDAEELEALIQNDEILGKKYMYDATYMNIIDRTKLAFEGATATESLEYVRSSYLVPMGFRSPTLPFFKSYNEEKDAIESILPFNFKLTLKKTLLIDISNFDSMKAVMEQYMDSTDRFEFNCTEHKKRFCEIFNIDCDDDKSDALEAVVVESEVVDAVSESESLFDMFEKTMLEIGNRSILKDREKWVVAVDDLIEEYGEDATNNVLRFLSSGHKDTSFWLKTITSTAKLIKHFEAIEQAFNVEQKDLEQKIKSDPEVKLKLAMMEANGVDDSEITRVMNELISKKINDGTYETRSNEAPWQTEKRMKREENEKLLEDMRAAGFDNYFDYIKSR